MSSDSMIIPMNAYVSASTYVHSCHLSVCASEQGHEVLDSVMPAVPVNRCRCDMCICTDLHVDVPVQVRSLHQTQGRFILD